MKRFMIVLSCVMFMGSMIGCGKTLAELKDNGNASIEHSQDMVNQGVFLVSTFLKKVVAVAGAVADTGKKVVEDSKDNANAVVNTVAGQATK